jgi:hypothetical protein
MVTMRDRGRQDLATVLNFLRPREGGLRAEFLRNRSNVPSGDSGVVTAVIWTLTCDVILKHVNKLDFQYQQR